MAEESSEAWSFATARVPVKYALVRRRDGGPVAHAGAPLTGHVRSDRAHRVSRVALARHVMSDQIIEGADAMHQALAAGGAIELIWVKDGGRRFLVLGPRGGTPVVAVLRADTEPRF